MNSVIRDLDNILQEQDPSTLYVFRDPDISYVQSPNVSAAMIDITVEGRKIKWTYKLSEKEEQLSSVSSRKYLSEEYDNIFKLKHNMVCAGLGITDSDVKLYNYFPRQDDNLNALSPDTIIDTDNFILVIEVGTTMAMNKGAVKAEYEKKLIKYYDALHLRSVGCDRPIVYIPIIVSMNYVASGIKLSPSLACTLNFLFKLGLYIENRVVKPEDLMKRIYDSEEAVRVKALEDSFKLMTIPIYDPTGYNFTQPTFDHYRRYYNQDNKFLASFIPMFAIPRTTIKGSKTCEESMNSSFQALEIEMKKLETRSDQKAVVQNPLALPIMMEGSRMTFDQTSTTVLTPGHDLLLDFWDEAMLQNTPTDMTRFPEEDPGVLMKFAMSDEADLLASDDFQLKLGKVQHKDKKIWHRIFVNELSDASKDFLAMQGLNAKSRKENIAILEKVLYSKRGFSPDTPVDDVRRFLVNRSVMDFFPVLDSVPGLRSAIDLINTANGICGNNLESMDFLTPLINTKMFYALYIQSLIAIELSISLRQNVKSKEFVYKRLRGFCLEMIVHPTRSDSHIFYTIRYKGEILNDTVFKKTTQHEDWNYCEFVSMNKSKLNNVIKAPYQWLNTYLFWTFHLNEGVSKDEMEVCLKNMSQNEHAHELTQLTCLASLEDKAVTEEMINGIRYISMQFFKGPNKLSWPDPSKAISKLPVFLRSRLTVYVYNRLKEYCIKQMENLPIFDVRQFRASEGEFLVDNWANLLDPLTHRLVKKSATVINIFYLGYGKNKNENPNMNHDLQMIKKIMEYVYNEDKSKMNQYTGLEPKPVTEDFGPHEWSIEMVKDSLNIFKDSLKNRLGENFSDVLSQHAMKEMLRKTHAEALATMKASALFKNFLKTFSDAQLNLPNEDDQKIFTTDEYKELKKKKKLAANALRYCFQGVEMNPYDEKLIASKRLKFEKETLEEQKEKMPRKSCKCMESIVLELKSGLYKSPWMLFESDKIIKELKKQWGGVCCYLFKKNQHGGLREIYVLTMKSRIIQCGIETAFRCLCQMIEEETMTHPESKLDLLDRHQEEISNHAMAIGGKVLSRQSAEDKQKWNQNNNVNMYAFIACQLFNRPLAKFLFKGLSLWRGKKILLPDGVLNLLMTDVKLSDGDSLESLRSEFWGTGGRLLKEKGSIFMESNTGMWQGILHFTSSFQHGLQTLHYKKMLKMVYFPLIYNAGASKVDVVTMISSDDSMTKISVVIPGNLEESKVCEIDFHISQALFAQEMHANRFCMIESKKSVIASPTVGEFNSMFFIANGMFSPTIKPVLALLNIKLTENLTRRQEGFYNIMKDGYEAGLSHYQMHCHQVVQGLFHYHGMGLGVSPLFDVWCTDLKYCPDPTIGFFVLEPQYTCGLMGYLFAVYCAIGNSSIPVVVSYPRIIRAGLSDKINMTESIFSTHGNRLKWKRFAKSVTKEGWEDEIEKNPSLLYAPRSDNIDGVLTRLSVAAHKRGVYESLSTENGLPDLFASSVYCLNTPSFTIKSMELNRSAATEETTYKKQSLIRITRDAKALAEKRRTISNARIRKIQGMSIQTKYFARYTVDMTYDRIPLELKAIIFPNYKFYDNIIQKIEDIKDSYMVVPTNLYRKRKNVIYLKMRDLKEPVPLIDVCRSLWFDMKGPYGKTLIMSSFVSYRQSAYPWLDVNAERTLEQSQFSSHKQMYDFISSLTEKPIKSQPLCKRIHSRIPSQQVMESIIFNYYPGEKFTKLNQPGGRAAANIAPKANMDSKSLEPIQEYLYCFSSLLYSLLSFPMSDDKKQNLLEMLIRNSTINPYKIHEVDVPENLRIPTCIHQALAIPSQLEENVKLLISNRKGVCLLYLQEQIIDTEASKWLTENYEQIKSPHDPTKLKYYGYGKFLIIMQTCRAIIHVLHNLVVGVEVSDVSKVSDEWETILSKLQENKIRLDIPAVRSNWKYIRVFKEVVALRKRNYSADSQRVCVVPGPKGLCNPTPHSDENIDVIPIHIMGRDRSSGLTAELSQYRSEVRVINGSAVWMASKRSINGEMIRLCSAHANRGQTLEVMMDKYFTRPMTSDLTINLCLDWIYQTKTAALTLAKLTRALWLLSKNAETPLSELQETFRVWLGRFIMLRATHKNLLESKHYSLEEMVPELEILTQEELQTREMATKYLKEEFYSAEMLSRAFNEMLKGFTMAFPDENYDNVNRTSDVVESIPYTIVDEAGAANTESETEDSESDNSMLAQASSSKVKLTKCSKPPTDKLIPELDAELFGSGTGVILYSSSDDETSEDEALSEQSDSDSAGGLGSGSGSEINEYGQRENIGDEAGPSGVKKSVLSPLGKKKRDGKKPKKQVTFESDGSSSDEEVVFDNKKIRGLCLELDEIGDLLEKKNPSMRELYAREVKSDEEPLTIEGNVPEGLTEFEVLTKKFESYVNFWKNKEAIRLQDSSWAIAMEADESLEWLREQEERIRMVQNRIKNWEELKVTSGDDVSSTGSHSPDFQIRGPVTDEHYDEYVAQMNRFVTEQYKRMEDDAADDFRELREVLEPANLLAVEASTILDPLTSRTTIRSMMMIHPMLDDYLEWLRYMGVFQVLANKMSGRLVEDDLIKTVCWLMDRVMPEEAQDDKSKWFSASESDFPALE